MSISYLIGLFIFTLIIGLLLFRKSNKRDSIKKEMYYEKNIDIENVILSIDKANIKYKELIVKFHPDKYLDDQKKRDANLITQKLTANKRNYNKLVKIENEANLILSN